jgi:putative ABC transport system permease protein
MAINLAWCDIRNSLQRFLLTVIGVGAILTATMGINGLYRGVVHEALLLIRDMGADLWVVQGGRSGPFAESSTIPDNIERRLEGVDGVRNARRFIQFNKRFTVFGRRLNIAVTGLDFPGDAGNWLTLIDGRPISMVRGEAIADKSLGFVVGDTIRLGRDDITIVGMTQGQVDPGGDGLLFVTIPDAQDIDQTSPSEAILLNRAQRALDPTRQRGRVGAIAVELDPSADPTAVRNAIMTWGDVNVLSKAEQEDILLNGRLWRLRIQILAFVVTMFVVAGVVVGLIIYTMTIEKIHSIAVLKLIGAKDIVIAGMILQISMLIGVVAFVGAVIAAHLIYPHFPRTILILKEDVIQYFIILEIICMLASLVGIRRALAVRPQEILA